MKATQEQAVTVTGVIWDIQRCPVPLDVMLVGSVRVLNGYWRIYATLVLSPSLPLTY